MIDFEFAIGDLFDYLNKISGQFRKYRRCKTEGRHIFLGEKSKEESESRKLSELTEVAKVIFSKKQSVSPADLVKLVMEELDVKERMARNYIKFMKDHDIIEKNTNSNGDYSLPFLPF